MKSLFLRCSDGTHGLIPQFFVRVFHFDRSLFSVTTSLGTVTLFSLTVPILFECVMNSLIGTVNTAVLSGYSQNAVVAVGTANTLIGTFSVLFSIVATGATVVVSNYIGAEKLHDASKTATVAIIFCSLLAAICSAILAIFSAPLLGFMHLEKDVFNLAIQYFRVRAFFVFVLALTSVICAVMRCYGFPKLTVVIGLSTNAANLILNIFVIYCPKLSPVTGVFGVACACAASQVIGLVLSLFFFKKTEIRLLLPENFRVFAGYIKKILKIGVPTGFSNICYSVSNTITTSFIALLGTYALSAKVYYTTILSYVYLFSISAGSANSLLIGRLCGAGKYEQANKLNAQLVKLTVTVNLCFSLLVIILRYPLLSLFTDTKEIFVLALGVFAIDIITEQGRAVSQVYEYALHAAGDVMFTMVVTTISCWCCGVGLAYFFSIVCGFGIKGCWMGMALDETVRAVVTYLRWRTKKWTKKSNI